MAISTSKRLSGHEHEVIEDVRRVGQFGAMAKWGVRDSIAFEKWYNAQTGKHTYDAENGRYANKDPFYAIMEAIEKFILKTEERIKQLEEENNFLAWQLQCKSSRGKTITADMISRIENGKGFNRPAAGTNLLAKENTPLIETVRRLKGGMANLEV